MSTARRVVKQTRKANETIFSPTILFVFMNTFVLMFQFQVCVPTIANYIEHLGVHKNFAGMFIALASWGSAALQLLVFAILGCTSYKVAIAILLACMGIGNLLYAFALPANSILLLSVGRLMMALTSGLQITMTGIDRALSDPAKQFEASRLNSLMYALGACLAYFASAFTQETMVDSSDVAVNQWSVVGLLSVSICAVVFLFVLLRVPYSAKPKTQTSTTGSSVTLYTLLLSWCMIFVLDYLEVLRQVSIFQLWDQKWKFDSVLGSGVGVAMFAGFVFLGILCTMLLDHYIKPNPRHMCGVVALLSLLYIPLLPYAEMPNTASILLQSIFGIIFGFLVRNAFSYAVYLALQYVKTSRYPRIVLMITSIMMNLGVGAGSTVSTLFDLSPAPGIVGILFMAICTPCILCT